MSGGAAFPSPGVVIHNHHGEEFQQGAYEGMSLRDYFAIHESVRLLTPDYKLAVALTGREAPVKPDLTADYSSAQLLANAKWWAEANASLRYLCADAMLAESVK